MNILLDVNGMQVHTPRLLLRPFEPGDLDDFYAYASVPGVGEMAGWLHHKTIDETRDILRMFIDNHKELALYHQEDRRVIGSLGFHISWANEDERYAHLPSKDIGYVLSKAYWGQGLMPEAVMAAMDAAAIRFGIKAFTCCHFTHNTQSRRVIEKCGFTYVSSGVYHSSLLQNSFDDRRYIRLVE